MLWEFSPIKTDLFSSYSYRLGHKGPSTTFQGKHRWWTKKSKLVKCVHIPDNNEISKAAKFKTFETIGLFGSLDFSRDAPSGQIGLIKAHPKLRLPTQQLWYKICWHKMPHLTNRDDFVLFWAFLRWILSKNVIKNAIDVCYGSLARLFVKNI